ncbi:(deoxy)nucleoside triphosphate pyrophosphohydrolase [Flexivirga caeni]|uniref:8-oxo-dGTP diphosphatase n=1 Tax=Flexivirga caeni TaxID=2294115 RepID=A0A3M9MIM5_9MICO|nr:(deoxy)nucleoside triphosphate pyrophosphohydrolase [Flexivirga caeni]RNI25354.1 (deoxy)nucleoside triphosphate pyrophosphohydrolase [Flexivirga caeni]
MTAPIEVVGAAVVHDGLVLAAQRGPTMSMPGSWEFPGGKIEPGESPQEALVRELREELLCDVTVGEHVETTSHSYDFGIIILSTYFAAIEAGEPQATEHAELRWVPPSKLHGLAWAPADLPAVERVSRVLG